MVQKYTHKKSTLCTSYLTSSQILHKNSINSFSTLSTLSQSNIYPLFRPKEAFHLIYVNSTQGGKSKCWSSFKTVILEELPLKYLLYLEKLVLIRPSFLDKASSIVQFGVQNKFFNSKLEKFDSLRSYFGSIKKKIDEMKKFLPTEVIQEEEPSIENIIKANPFFICNFNQNRTSYESTGLKQ